MRLGTRLAATSLLIALVLASACSKGGDDNPTGPPGGSLELNSGSISSGGIYQHTFATANTYGYHCTIHGVGMAGTVIVANGQLASAAVSIGDNFYSPATVSIVPGGTVTWTNNGSAHTVTSH